MCFSATASFTASAVLFGIGGLTLRRVQRPEDRALAAIPVLFAIQQALEGVVWLSLGGTLQAMLGPATQVYSLFSHVLWPLYVPWAVWCAEPRGPRRRGLLGFLGIGALVGLFLLYGMFLNPIEARPVGQHIDYESPHFYQAAVLLGYLAATTVSQMISSHRWVRWFGALALVSAVATYLAYAQWFISVWCFFAAALSAVIYLHVRHRPFPSAGLGIPTDPRWQRT
ncbi:MAG: hypothetical protein A3E01_14465 [Gammaproteobacteria bacterium RIFCSPHIGHO2_12_FULL_63_22]|nr:MAG: hypothetical protein A3E01_14465 [Gammaproteobacteria bacterium RIFCSPHIGHO2_12_FULL_63_22]